MPLDALADAGVQIAGNEFLSQRENERYMRNQTALYRMSQSAQKNAIVNEVESMRMAGISPALAAGKTAAANVPTAPSQSKSVNVQADISALAKLDAETDLLRAQAENLRSDTGNTMEDTAGKELQNQITRATNEWIDAYVQKLYPKDYENFRTAHPGESLNIGYLKAHNGVLDSVVRDAERDVALTQADIDKQVALIQSADPKFAQAIASLPVAQRDSIYSNIARLQVLNRVSEADISVSEERQKEIRQSIDKLWTETKKMLVDSPMLANYAGDRDAFLNGALGNVVGMTADVVGGAVKAYGASRGFAKYAGQAVTKKATSLSVKSAAEAERSAAQAEFSARETARRARERNQKIYEENHRRK